MYTLSHFFHRLDCLRQAQDHQVYFQQYELLLSSHLLAKGNSVLEEAEGEYEGKACTVLRTFNFCTSCPSSLIS